MLVLRSSNIQNSKLDFNDNVFVKNEVVPNKIRTKHNDVLMCVRNGSKNLVGKTALITKEYENLAWGAFMNIIRPLENNNYLYFFLNSRSFKQQIYKDLATATVNQITMQTLNDIKLFLPNQVEQQKIADFLSLIDQRIEKQRQLIESLKKYKRGLLSAIFERKIRFKDDNGNNYLVWSTYKLDDICLYKNGEAFEQQVNNSGMYKLISLNSLDIDGNLKPAEKFVNSANWYLEENDLIMVLSDVATGEFLGLCDVIPNNNEYVLNQRMGLLRLKTEDNIKYIRYFINANQKYFKKHGQGSSQKNLSKDDILNFEIKIPSINEQNKIVTIIESINKNILLNIEKISHLEKYKTGLLQQMFI